jgi:ribosomal protein S18 acetylase RimI-like enzyme
VRNITPQNLRITSLRLEHVDEVVTLYERELPLAIFNWFGPTLTRSFFVRGLGENWGYVAQNPPSLEVIGFVIGLREDVSLVRCLDWKSIFHFARCSVRRPAELSRLVNSILHSLVSRRQENRRPKTIEMSHLAVAEEFQGVGIGTKLISALETRAQREGFENVFTRTSVPRLADFYKRERVASISPPLSRGGAHHFDVVWSLKN